MHSCVCPLENPVHTWPIYTHLDVDVDDGGDDDDGEGDEGEMHWSTCSTYSD